MLTGSPSDIGGARLWNTETAQPMQTYATGHVVFDAAFSPDFKSVILALESHHSRVQIWDVDKAIVTQHLKGHNKDVNTARFSPDGASSEDRTVLHACG